MHHQKAPVGDNPGFREIKQSLEAAYPALTLDHATIHGAETELRAAHGGMRVFWIFDGTGEVFLPAGYRTLEGDGAPLPADYQPEPADPAFLETLAFIDARRGTFTPGAWTSIKLILDRRQGDTFTGDIAAYLWNLEHTPRPWSSDPGVEAAVESIHASYRNQGYSVKTTGSWEPVGIGDQLVACGDQPVRVRGDFRCMSIEDRTRHHSHISTARRLPYLLDTAGGCSFDFEPYRRLPLTWHVDTPGGHGDGVNFVNSHIVNIPEELSSTHFHPPVVLGRGGVPQTEMYLVLDPEACGIDDKGRKPAILLFPDLRDLTRWEKIDLAPGDLVLIPPGVGHRGLDVFVNVLTIPGFKPHNEFYIDQHILDATDGASPHNEPGLARKNLENIADYLAPPP